MRGLGLARGMQVRRSRGVAVPSGPVPVWSDDRVDDWTPVNVTLGDSGSTDPEIGGLRVTMRETTTDGNHYVYKEIPLEQGKTYRLRFLVKGVSRTVITINLPVADGGKYWIGTIGSTTPDLASGIGSMQVEEVGDMQALSVEFTYGGATGNVGFSIGTCIPGPNASFPGEVAKGLDFGNVKLYEVAVPLNALYHSGGTLSVSSPIVGPNVGDFAAGAWFRIDTLLEQYVALIALQKNGDLGTGGKYAWFGFDSEAGGGPGNRGLGFFDGNGGHCFELLPALGTWFHAAVVKVGTEVRAFLNGALCTWDTGGSPTFMSAEHAAYTEIDRLRFCNEIGWDSPGHVGAIRGAFILEAIPPSWGADELALIMPRSDPRGGEAINDGTWPLTTDSSLFDTANIQPFTKIGGTWGVTSKPAGITLP